MPMIQFLLEGIGENAGPQKEVYIRFSCVLKFCLVKMFTDVSIRRIVADNCR